MHVCECVGMHKCMCIHMNTCVCASACMLVYIKDSVTESDTGIVLTQNDVFHQEGGGVWDIWRSIPGAGP